MSLPELADANYESGKKRAGIEVLRLGMQLVGCEDRDAAGMAKELAEARIVLRRLCETHGDLDWDDNLHLADVIDKHLGKYLEE